MSLQGRNSSGLIDRSVSYIASSVTLCILGLVIMITCYSACIAFIYNADGVAESSKIARIDIIKTVALDSIRTSLGGVFPQLPWPSGVTIARIQGRMPEFSPLGFHVGINAIIFLLIGFIAGRVRLPYASILVPILIFFQTYGFLRGEFYKLVPFNLIPIGAVFLMQVLAMASAAYFSKHASR